MHLVWSDGQAVAGEAAATDPVAYATRNRQPVHRRPWVFASMVASIDGSTVVGGRAGPLSSPVDQAVFGAARDAGSMVLVGAETVRAERYGAPRRAGQRIAVVTRSGELDYESALFTSGAGIVVIPEDGTFTQVRDDVEVVRAGTGSVDVEAALHLLAERFGPLDSVHLEGGASLLAAAFAADVVDEAVVTTSPNVVLGTGKRVAVGYEEQLRRFELADLAVDDGFVFSRWVRQR